MPLVARFGDVSSGHCFPSRPNVGASPDVFVNSLGWHRQGDPWDVHCCPPSCHSGSLASGSSTVYVNGLQGGRQGDPVNCGDHVQSHSPNVNAGG